MMFSPTQVQSQPAAAFLEQANSSQLSSDRDNAIDPTVSSQVKAVPMEPLSQNQLFDGGDMPSAVPDAYDLDGHAPSSSRPHLNALPQGPWTGCSTCKGLTYCTGHTAAANAAKGAHSPGHSVIQGRSVTMVDDIPNFGSTSSPDRRMMELDDGSDDSFAFGSWTTDDDNASNLYFDINEQISRFRRDENRDCMVVASLGRSQRRIVHAIAHLMHLGHRSVGEGKRRNMVISKAPTALRNADKLLGGTRPVSLSQSSQRFNCLFCSLIFDEARVYVNHALRHHEIKRYWKHSSDDKFHCKCGHRSDEGTAFLYHIDNDHGHRALRSTSPDLQSYRDMPPSPAREYDYPTDSALRQQHDVAYNGYSSNYSSAGSGASYGSSKRQRNPRIKNGYWCKDCGKKFHVKCDLTHHQRTHLPEEQLPHKCGVCNKGFLFPKDLKRHEKTHSTLDWVADPANVESTTAALEIGEDVPSFDA